MIRYLDFLFFCRYFLKKRKKIFLFPAHKVINVQWSHVYFSDLSVHRLGPDVATSLPRTHLLRVGGAGPAGRSSAWSLHPQDTGGL